MKPEAVPLADDPKADLLERGREVFQEEFGFAPIVAAFAPGRAEILGNHTDYNGGFVLSVAVELGTVTCAGFAPGAEATSGEVVVRSELQERSVRIEATTASRHEGPDAWANYVKGVLREIDRDAARWSGLRLAISSDLPPGSGMSSSAALEVSTAVAAIGCERRGATATATAAGLADRMKLAQLCHRAETEFVGVPCGILDPFSSIFGRKDHVLFLDCDTLEHEAIRLSDDEVTVVVAPTGAPHSLVDGQYADLAASCARAATRLDALLPHRVRFLRDVSIGDLQRHAAELEPVDRRRAEHVVRENARVLEGREVAATDLARLGDLMSRSHASSRDLLGNSSRELDALVEAGRSLPDFLGGKLCGGGFGGSVVFLVRRAGAAAFRDGLAAAYRERTGLATVPQIAAVGDGARWHRLPAA